MKAFLWRRSFFAGSFLSLLLVAVQIQSSHAQNIDDPRSTTAGSLPAPGVYDSTHADAVFAMISGAQQSIDIEIYEMADARFIEAIRSAMNDRGVRVRIVQEPKPVGGKCNIFDNSAAVKDTSDCTNQKKLVRDVIAAGGSYVPFNKAELCADPRKVCYLHGKLIVVDGRTALVSDGNFNSTNLCDLSENPSRCDRDFSVVTEDPEVVQFFSSVVEKDLAGNRYDMNSLFTDSLRQKVTVSPLSLQPLTDFINSAQTSIDIENQYLKEKNFNAALMAAPARGVQVNATVSSLCAFGHPSKSTISTSTKLFSSFDSAGINTRLFTGKIRIGGKPGYLHAKVIVVDGSRAWIGSVNGSTAAMSNNREFGIFIDDASVVRDSVLPTLQSDHSSPYAETWQESLQCTRDYTLSGADPEPDPGNGEIY